MIFLLSADFFSKLTFSKNSFRNTIRISNRLAPDLARPSVGPDLGPNCFQTSAADDKFEAGRQRVKGLTLNITYSTVKVQNFQNPELLKPQS